MTRRYLTWVIRIECCQVNMYRASLKGMNNTQANQPLGEDLGSNLISYRTSPLVKLCSEEGL